MFSISLFLVKGCIIGFLIFPQNGLALGPGTQGRLDYSLNCPENTALDPEGTEGSPNQAWALGKGHQIPIQT